MYFLAIQNTYEAIEIALCSPTVELDTATVPKINASKLILVALEQLLTRNNCSLTDIAFIAVNQGPGPFTTLRVVIATVNGLSFARKIELVGVNGLHALLQEQINSSPATTIALLNAFNQDVYFGIAQEGIIVRDGYHNIHTLLTELMAHLQGSINFVGNAVSLYRNEITSIFGPRAIIIDPVPETCSLVQIKNIGFHQWQQRINICFRLMPLYLKPFISPTHAPHGYAKTPQS